ncbi:1-acyl-sn-glycerol-3-phosphate acyltransferase [Streptomyces caeruleatus]
MHKPSRLATTLLPLCARLTVTTDTEAELAPGTVIAAHHTSLADPAVVLTTLHRLGVQPVIITAAGLWRVPLPGRALTREGHVPEHRHHKSAARCLDAAAAAAAAAAANERGRLVLIYGEGGIPTRTDATEAAPAAFRTGLARLTE